VRGVVPKRKQLQFRLCRNPKIKQFKVGHIDVDRGVCVPRSQTHRCVQYARDVRLEVACVIFDRLLCPHRSQRLYVRLSHKNSTWCFLHRPAVNVPASLIFHRCKQKRYCDGHTQRIHHGHIRSRLTRKVFCTCQIDTVCTYVYLWHCRAKIL